ncbi:P43 5S RNA-binding protein-like [Lampris incognitus]|uniref:P43 5S RNA-binding protein-like n=1 Tax=Lampris incognitus TaxID=2546036 RepID=UPI0024B62C63|nr:P43 5S RNA-binding protein-like [Lampris incognitus]
MAEMNVSWSVPGLQLFNCTQAECGATFTRQWRLREHEKAHIEARPFKCRFVNCGRRFTRKAHLRRHAVQHTGVKAFICSFQCCPKSFFNAHCREKHVQHAHGKGRWFKCSKPNCSLTFKKRRLLKLHMKEHGVTANFRCSKDGCGAMFDSHIARKAHEKKHAGYRCQKANCNFIEYTWGKLQKHMAKHPVTFTCRACQKVFKKAGSLSRHERAHTSHKPVLVCPKSGCSAFFSTTFNLEHHIHKVHLEHLKYSCLFPDCPRMFAMRESMTRHLRHHDPITPALQKRLQSKLLQKRVSGRRTPLVEEDLRRLFDLRMRIHRRAKVEANLLSLFNERKLTRNVDPEVNLRNLFSIKPTLPCKPSA